MASASQGSSVYDVVIIGAGIMGSCSAYECSRRGLSVLLLEQFDFLHRKGSSHGESRIIRRTYPEDWYTEMMPQAYRLWEEASQEAGYSPLTTTGSLDFGPYDSVDLRELISACKKHSVPHEVLSLTELRERFPVLSFAEGTVGVYCSEGGVLHATKACAMFQQLAVKHGARVLDRAKVTSIVQHSVSGSSEEGEVLLEVGTGGGVFQCRSCVLACGAWTASLAKTVCDVELPVQPLQVYTTYWRVKQKHQSALEAQNNCPVLLHYGAEDLVYGIPILDYQGLVKVSSHHGWPCDPDNRPVEKPPVVEPMQRWMGKWLHDKVDLEPALVEACMYSMTPDQDFILDTLPLPAARRGAQSVSSEQGQQRGGVEKQSSKVVVASGFSGHGFKFGPLVGAVVADLVESGTSVRVPLHMFLASRFSDGNQGNVRISGPQVKVASEENLQQQ